MNLPRFSVHRPVFTTMATMIVVILGLVSLARLPTDLLPEIELPTLTIRTAYENASPEVMERRVTRVIEEAVATVPGVSEITSVSAEGLSNVRIGFTWGTDLSEAANDLRDRIDRNLGRLPEDAERPRLMKFDVANFPIMILGVSSPLDPLELTDLIENQVTYRLEQIHGVATVDVWGGFNREVQVNLDPGRVQALQLPLDQVIESLRAANIDLPAGELEQGRYEVMVRAPAEYTDLDQIRDTVVAMREGAPVTLGQIAEVEETHAKLSRIVRINGVPGIRMAVRKQADANTVEVTQAVEAEMERINRDFPQISMVSIINQGTFIERSIANVARSVGYGGLLAGLVLLFFLRHVRSTVVIALSIPISVVATFALVYFGGMTLNLMTLGGLALGVGMMVDSSIVVLENIYRRRQEEGEDAEEASVRGASEVAGAIIASTITTLVIFLPLIFIEGVAGVLFSELAYVIAFSLVCALAVALSLIPMLSSRLLASSGGRRKTRGKAWEKLAAGAEGAFRRLDEAYRRLLGFVLRHPVGMIAFSVVSLAASLLLVPYIGTELMPPSDEGEVRVTGQMEPGTRLDLVDRQTRRLEDQVYAAVPELVAGVSSVGASGWRPQGGAEGAIRIALTPATRRDRSNAEVAADLRRKVSNAVPGMTVRVRAPQGQFILNRILAGDASLGVEVRGFDLEILDRLAAQVTEAIRDVPGVTDVEPSRQAGVPQQFVHIDRTKAADLGLSARDIARALETALAGTRAGDFRSGNETYRILVRLKDAERLSLDEILNLTLTSSTGEAVALRNVVTDAPGTGPVLIDRKDQQRVVTVAANVDGRDMGSVAADISERLASIPRPVGYDLAVAGAFEEQQKAFHELILSLALALLLVYMVLACQYESFVDPLVVMLSVPLAAIGVLVVLFLTNTTLNLQSYIGCIMLGGIVVNNAILLVDQARQLRSGQGLSARDAVAEAGRRRLRPILMTTFTTIIGLLPLALGIGEGADAQAPLARAVVGGLAGSTLVTLVLIPAVYSLVHRQSQPAVAAQPARASA